MSETQTKSPFHPRRWHLATWILVLLWLTMGTLGVYPHQPDMDWLEDANDPNLGGPVAYSVSSVSGFPLFYLYHNIEMPAKTFSTTMNYSYLVVDLALVIALPACIVYCLQRLGQFSIKSMMIGMALIAILIVLGQVIGGFGGVVGVYYYVIALYCSPLIIAAVVFAKNRFTRQKDAITNEVEA